MSLKAIGFQLMFENRAAKGLESVRKDVLKIDKIFKDNTKRLSNYTKGMAEHFKILKAKSADYLTATEDGFDAVSNSVEKISRTLGDRVGEIVQSLMSAEVALAGIGVVALKAGGDYDRVLKQMSRSTTLTDEDIEKLGDRLEDVSMRTGAGIQRTGNIMLHFQERMRMMPEEAERMAETVLRAANITKESDQAIGAGLTTLRMKFKFTVDELEGLTKGAIAVSQATGKTLEETFREFDFYGEALARLPQEVQKKVAPQLIQLAGVMSDQLVDAPMVLNKMLRGMTDVTDKEFSQMTAVMSRGGQDAIEAFRTGIQEGDITTAFQEMIKSLQTMNEGDLKRMASVWEDLFGMDIGTIDQLRRIDPTNVEKIAEAYGEAAANAEFLVKQDEKNRSLSEELSALWEKTLTALVPVGMVLLEVVITVIEAFQIAANVLKAIMDIPIIGWFVKMGIAAAIFLNALGGIVALIGLLKPMLIGGALAALKAITVVLGVALALVKLIGAALMGLMFTPLGWILAVATAITLVFLNWEKIVKWIGDAIDWVLEKMKRAWEGFKDLLVFAGDALTGGMISHVIDAPGAADGAVVKPTPGGTLMNVGEGGETEVISPLGDLKAAMGSDSIVDAVWGAAKMIVDAMSDDMMHSPSRTAAADFLGASTSPSFRTPRSY